MPFSGQNNDKQARAGCTQSDVQSTRRRVDITYIVVADTPSSEAMLSDVLVCPPVPITPLPHGASLSHYPHIEYYL